MRHVVTVIFSLFLLTALKLSLVQKHRFSHLQFELGQTAKSLQLCAKLRNHQKICTQFIFSKFLKIELSLDKELSDLIFSRSFIA